jgi:uncharacterized protein YbjT (DUF2867 family)
LTDAVTYPHMAIERRRVLVTGGTGYIGRHVLPMLVARGHQVRALVRPGSVGRLTPGCDAVVGDALDERTFADATRGSDTLLQLVGTPHPSPSKAAEFERVDLASVRASVKAAEHARLPHFVYVSVAPSSSVMRAYADARARGEVLVREAIARGTVGTATFLRPWYVLGPGHRWPYALVPLYWLLEAIPSTRDRARQLGLVTIEQMARTIVHAIEHPPANVRVVSVPEIRRGPAAPGAD